VSDDDEFYECFDNEHDIKMLEKNMPSSSTATSTNGHHHHAGVIRRTASFTNIDRIVEVPNEQEDEEDADEPR
jgi:hypothetical protein